MAWEKIKPHTGKGTMPNDMVSIDKSRKMNVSRIREKLGEHVELLYDRDTDKMALKPTAKTLNSYQIRKSGASWAICLIRFINYYGLEHRIGFRYRVTYEDDLFVIDLNKPVTPTVPRGRVPHR